MAVNLNDIKEIFKWSDLSLNVTYDSQFYYNPARSGLKSFVDLDSSLTGSLLNGDASLGAAALAQFSAVTPLTFSSTTQDIANFAITKGTVTLDGYGGGVGGGGNYSSSIAILDGTQPAYLYLHEIGHALGLRHPKGGNGTDPDFSRETSVMSYNNTSIATAANVKSLMIYDIALLQEIYGRNTSYNSGNNVYELSGNTASPANTSVSTIWDAGGIDTLTVNASVTTGAVLDLRGGVDENGNPYWSHLDNEYVAIAFDKYSSTGYVKIEKALGGAGDDTIYGSKGNDTLDGGDGLNTIYGGEGDDLIYMNGTGGFVDGGMGDDTIVLDVDAIQDYADATYDIKDTNWSITDADGKFSIKFENSGGDNSGIPYAHASGAPPVDPDDHVIYLPIMTSTTEISSTAYAWVLYRHDQLDYIPYGGYRPEFGFGSDLKNLLGPLDMHENLGIKLATNYKYDSFENVIGSQYAINFSGFSSGLDTLTLESLINSGRLHIDMVNNIYKF